MKNNSDKKVVTRFAPSPTGFMHVGGVRTALFAWAFARKNNGTFILRIEDTDKKREVEGSIQQIIDSLAWLGIEWDEGVDIGGPHAPYLQSERLSSYQKYAKILIDKGFAYTDPYAEEELAAFRKQAEEEKRPFLYRNHRPENPPVWDGSKPLRFKNTKIISREWTDLVRGPLKAGPEALDDFILIKSDGYPTYNFAHIIDDLEMEVTHIFRADEFISSVPNYLALYEALGIERPELATLPPILGPDGKKKLGKRDGAKDILEYKKEGYLPEAMMNFLAFIGWNPGTEQELFSPEEFINAFSVEHIQRAGAKFNEEKLDWYNREYIKKLPAASIAIEIKKRIPAISDSDALKLVEIIKERITKFDDISRLKEEGELEYYFTVPTIDPQNLICPEKLRKGQPADLALIKMHLEKIIELISLIPENVFNEVSIKEAVWNYATEKGRGIVLWAMRYSLSGKEKSPDPFALAAYFGKDETINRLKKSVQQIS